MDIYSTDDNKYKFLKKAQKVTIVSILMTIAIFIFTQKLNKTHFEMFAVLNNLFFFIFFQVVSGILRSYFFSNSDPLLFVIALELAIRYQVLMYYYPIFKIMVYSNVSIISYAWISMFLYHTSIPQTIIFYNLIITLVLLMQTAFANSLENSKIMEIALNSAIETEKQYYINILDNLNVGFFITEGSKVTLLNKNISNIMDLYSKSKLKLESANEIKKLIDMNEDVQTEEQSKVQQKSNLLSYIKTFFEEEDIEEVKETGNILKNGIIL